MAKPPVALTIEPSQRRLMSSGGMITIASMTTSPLLRPRVRRVRTSNTRTPKAPSPASGLTGSQRKSDRTAIHRRTICS